MSYVRFGVVVCAVFAFVLSSVSASASLLVSPQVIDSTDHQVMQDCHVYAGYSPANKSTEYKPIQAASGGASCCTASCMAPPLTNTLNLELAELSGIVLPFSSMRSNAPYNTSDLLYRPPIF